METRGPVVCVGGMVADVVARPMKVLPECGRMVLVEEMRMHTGGCAINTATALALLGIPVEIIGKVGTDSFGDLLLAELEERGVGTDGVSRDLETGTSVTMVMVDPDGERRFVHYLGANARLTIEDVDFELVRESAILHVASALALPGIDGEPTADLLRFAKSAGVITYLDTVWDATGRWMELLAPCMPFVDYFVPSLSEAQALTGVNDPEEAACELLGRGIGTVALKMGVEGCLVMTSDGQSLRMPAFKVGVVDATGAGDAFAAGFIAGVWRGWSLGDTVRLANAVGALCVTALGATGGVRSLEETQEFMRSAQVCEGKGSYV